LTVAALKAHSSTMTSGLVSNCN